MSKTFEKWWDADAVVTNQTSALAGWKASRQNLEVTPELVDAAKEGLFGSSYYDLGYQGYIGDAAIHEALTAVFNAIKEQGDGSL